MHKAVCVAIIMGTMNGCTSGTSRADGEPSPTPPRAVKPVVPPTKIEGRDAAPAPAVTGEVPQDRIIQAQADLGKRLGVAVAAIKVVSAEAVDWPNGGLGCAEPGRMYTMAIVPGYRVELEAAGRTYSYHGSRTGALQLCERPPGAAIDTN